MAVRGFHFAASEKQIRTIETKIGGDSMLEFARELLLCCNFLIGGIIKRIESYSKLRIINGISERTYILFS